MGQPKHYKDNLPRVSHIVEHIYPFTWTPWEKFFLNWLKEKKINANDYMTEASEWGTYIHSQLEKYLNWEELAIESSRYDDFIINGIEAIEEYEMKPIKLEYHLYNEQVQWTCDFYWYVKWKKALVDYKTYWLAKYKFWLDVKYKKPIDKLKKARVQLSLYKYLLWRNVKLFVLELDKDRYYMHELKYLGDKYIENLIKDYYEKGLQNM